MASHMKSAFYLAAILSSTALCAAYGEDLGTARGEDLVPNPSFAIVAGKPDPQLPVEAPQPSAQKPVSIAPEAVDAARAVPNPAAEPALIPEPAITSAATAPLDALHDRPARLETTGEPRLSASAEKVKAAVTALILAPAAKAADKKRREAIASVYAARNFEPLWVTAQHWSAAAGGAMNRLEKANEDGLTLAEARMPSLADGKYEAEDVRLSDLVTQYISQASGSRIDPATVSKLITARPTGPDFAKSLIEISSAANADAALQASNPPQSGYVALRVKLAELRRETVPVARPAIPAGPVLKVGMKDERVLLIRERFGLDMAPTGSTSQIVYDTRVAAAVADFQSSSGLPASGTLTPRTIAMLSGGQPARLESEIIANMEIWRWLPRDLGHDHIEVNIPDFTARLYHGDTLAYSTRVVVGKTDTPTPIFSNVMQFLIVNPYWNVPLSIIKKEMLPKLAADPDYFARHGYELIQSKGQFYVRQPPGEANALGRIKFMFPNEHSVYLHDTPSKSLFSQTQRAFSHGCVRVDQPFKFAEAVLGGGWSEQRVRAMIGGQERTVNLPQALPIHLMYLTARVDDTGKLLLRDDIYGYARKIKMMLGLEG